MFKVVPEHKYAMVNIEGVVKSTYTGNIMKPRVDKDGYWRVAIWVPTLKKSKKLLVHRCIALAFLPNPDNKTCINHMDCDRTNNSLDNLEWCSVAENNYHGMKFGSIVVGRKGKGNPNNTHEEDTVHSVCELLEKGYSQVKIAAKLNVPKSFVYDVRSATTWKDIHSQYNIPPVKKKLQDSTVRLICEDLESKVPYKVIEEKYSLGEGVLRFIKNKKTFKHISKDYNWD